MSIAALLWGVALCAVAVAGFANGRYAPSTLFLIGGLVLCGWGWWTRRSSE